MKSRNTKFISISSFIQRRKLFFITIFLPLTILQACKKESDVIGLELQPASEILNAFYTDSSTIVTIPLREDSIRTDGKVMLLNNLIGSYHDPVFGTSTAGFYSQYRLTSSNVNFGTNAELDSIVLTLAFKGHYGDTTASQTLSVYKMTEPIYADSNYYSNSEFAIDNTPVGTLTFQPQPNTNVVVGKDTLPPHIRIKLDNSFGNQILNAGSATLASNDTWLQFLPGLFVKANDVMNNGAILYIDYASPLTNLDLFYKNSNLSTNTGNRINFKYPFVISANAARVNVYDHEYATSQIDFGDTLQGSITSYIQSMAGVKTKIYFPHLETLAQLGPIAINKAELVIKVEDGSTSVYSPHERLSLFASDSTGKNVILTDQIGTTTSSFFGGNYNTDTKEYVFNIPRYTQELINGTRENYGLFLLATNAASNANRTVIGGGSSISPAQMQFRIIYTRIQ